MRGRALSTSIVLLALSGAAAPAALAQSPVPAPAPPATGGAAYGADSQPLQPVSPGLVGQLLDGIASAPDQAPPAVRQAIWAANQIVGLPYQYGGGHNLRFMAPGYDCSGTVSFALHGGGLLPRPLDSSQFLRWGEAGPGAWITVYANRGHAFVVIAGMRLDTSAAGDPSGARGPRWRPTLRSTRGYRARHPVGL